MVKMRSRLTEEERSKVHLASRQVDKFLREFNLKYPDPDAKEVEAEFSNLRLPYIPPMCAAVVAGRPTPVNFEETRELDGSLPEQRKKKMTLLESNMRYKRGRIEFLKRRKKKQGRPSKVARKFISPERESH